MSFSIELTAGPGLGSVQSPVRANPGLTLQVLLRFNPGFKVLIGL